MDETGRVITAMQRHLQEQIGLPLLPSRLYLACLQVSLVFDGIHTLFSPTDSMRLRLLVSFVVFGWMLWHGYQRRRNVWTRRSWMRFGALLAIAVSAFAVAMAMAVGVDNGVYEGMSPVARSMYFYTLMTLAILGPIAGLALIIWFARGRPERQLG